MDTEACGIASSMLGAGRETKESEIDYSAGICICKKTGDYVNTGDCVAVLYASHETLFAGAAKRYWDAIEISDEKPKAEPLIYARVTIDGVEFCR